MASTIAAITTGVGGVVTTADATGNLNLLAGTTTVVALTTAGAAVTGTLSATGITTVAAGSAALPAIVSTTGTADTGLWFPAADTVAASTAGTERLRIDSSGNVGVGVTPLTWSVGKSIEVGFAGSSLFGAAAGNLQIYSNVYYNGGSKFAGASSSYASSFQLVNSSGGSYFAFNTSNAAGTAGNAATMVEVMRIDSSGNVGIGTTYTSLFNSVGGSTRLAVCGSSATTDILGNTGASISIINTDTTANNTAGLHFARADTDDTPNYAGASIVAQFPETQVASQYPKGLLAFLTSTAANNAPSEKMRIDASGNVGIGTSSPDSGTKLHVAGGILTSSAFSGTVGSTGGIDYSGAGLRIFSMGTSGATKGTYTWIAKGADGSSSTQMTIDNVGNVRIGIATGNADAKATIYGGATDSSPCIELYKGSTTTTTAQVFARFQTGQDTTPAGNGSITSNGAASVTFTAWSDRRLKENIVDLPSQIANIMALRPVEFDYIGYENGKGHQLGFIAQEVQEIYPDLVGEGTDGMLTLSDMNKNDARLIKCIQEQQALILALTDRIAALEAK